MENNSYILVVGGAGYIGSHTNLELKRKGYKTILFDNLSLGHEQFIREDNFIEGDLSNLADIRKVFEAFNIGAVIHFAVLSQVGESVKDPESYYINNVVNTLNLLKVMKEFDVKYFILSSTAAVYDNPEKIPITENTPVKPINPYGKTKYMIEEILNDYSNAYEFKFVSLRYFNACGADSSATIGEWHEREIHIIPLVLDVAIGRREKIKIFGDDYNRNDGTCIRDYIHVTDLANAHILALEYLYENNEFTVFNLGNGYRYSVKEIVDMVENVTGIRIEREIDERRVGDPDILIADTKKANRILKWKPTHNLETIILSAWEWHEKFYYQCK